MKESIMRASWPLLALSLILACGDDPPSPSDAGDTDLGTRDTGPSDTGARLDGTIDDTGPTDGGQLEACDPSLTITATSAAVRRLALYTVRAEGGTGAYRFSLETNQSGALINQLSGSYLAGDRGGSLDVVRVTDVGCLGEARLDIRVVEPLELRPSDVEIVPSGTFTFDVLGGSGRFSFRMTLANSGGTVSPTGLYAAGPSEGLDRVEALDLGTNETAEAVVRVSAGATLSLVPDQVFVGVDQEMDLGTVGGSGFVTVSGGTGFTIVDGQRILGVSPGRSQVTLQDRYTGQTVPATISVVASPGFTPVAMGWAIFQSVLLSPGDLDGDGKADVILAHPDSNLGGVASGAAYVYRGNATGLDPTPAQTIPGHERRDELGRAAVTADFDADGHLDLAIGVPRSDLGGGDVGAVEIYSGVPGGLFATTPSQVLTGRFGGDLFGWALAACDFNADGQVDLAVGAYNAEDRDRPVQTADQGGVSIYLGEITGFRESPNQFLWGDVPDGVGGWSGVGGMHFGIALASGDFDDDGACDLAAGTYEFDVGQGTNDGLLYVFRGAPRAGAIPGGLDPRPGFGWSNQDANDRGGNFARNLAMGDVDGDGKDDVLSSHHNYDNGGTSDGYGAARIYKGRAFTGEVATLLDATPAADWSYTSDQGNDQVGFAVAIKDATGDGLLDVIIGSLFDEVMGGTNDVGALMVFAGRAGMLPDVIPTRTAVGLANGDRFGAAVQAIGDQDGDGRAELIALSAYADVMGEDVGAPYVVPGDEAMPVVALELPNQPAGVRFGQSASVVGDVTGDGFSDLVVGAPYQAVATRGLQLGQAYLYPGSATGFAASPASTFTNFSQHNGFDNFGWGVSTAGDFDCDGVSDLAILARFEDLQASTAYPSASYAGTASCAAARNNSGAVFVWRGSASGPPAAEPSFIYFGSQSGQGLREVAGGLDTNNDGCDDLIVGSLDWDAPGNVNNTGGVAVVRGRPRDGQGRIELICNADFELLGRASNDNLGRNLAPLGDLDADGCDDFATGAPGEDPTLNNEGGVRIFFGWGGGGCAATPQMAAMRSGLVNSAGGYSVGGGLDVDGDGIPDLAIGLPTAATNGNTYGAAQVVLGSYLRTLTRQPATPATVPAYGLFTDPGAPPAMIFGVTPGEQLGQGVGLVRLPGNGRGLAAGSPRGAVGGRILTGGARTFRYLPGVGLQQAPQAAFGGETVRIGGLVGDFLATGLLNGSGVILVGGFDGSGRGLDTGSLYPLIFGP